MPALGLGTWKSDAGAVGAAVREALAAGYRHIDCAPIYGNEPEIGEALANALHGGLRRSDVWVTSKLWNNRHLKNDVGDALKQTLADLRLDYLDLYLIHWPVALRPDVGFPERGEDFLPLDAAPVEETWAAMEAAVDAGLCRHIGLSNFSPARIRRVTASSRIRPAALQVEAHPLLAQTQLLELCREEQLHFIAYSPLGSPDRPASLVRGDDPTLLEMQEVRAIAAENQMTPGQVLISWAITRGTAAIPKSVNPIRLRENLAAASLPLDATQMARLDQLDRGLRFIDGSLWTIPGSPYTIDGLWAGG